MLAFIFGGIAFVLTVVVSLFMLFAAGMSDSPSASQEATAQAGAVFVVGVLISAGLIGSHWLPHVGW